MDKLETYRYIAFRYIDSSLHDLEHLYYDGRNWAQTATFDDVLKLKIWPIVGVTFLTLYVIKKYFAGGVCRSSARLDGKTVIVTGCNAGIGKETAKDFYRRGARVIMACRNRKKAHQATTEIFQTVSNVPGSPVGELVNYKLDLSSMASVREFCDEVLEKEDHIDILVNNAGIIAPVFKGRQLTEDGFDLTIGTNHLGPFLLTNLLLDKMFQSPHKPARIVNVASNAYRWGAIRTEDINFGAAVPYPGAFKAYGQSKLCNIFFTQELAKRTEELNISTYVLHPGGVRTNIATGKFPWYIRCFTKIILFPFMYLFAKSAKQGAQTTIYCAVDKSVAKESGFFYEDCQKKSLKPIGVDQEKSEKLWALSEELVKLKPK